MVRTKADEFVNKSTTRNDFEKGTFLSRFEIAGGTYTFYTRRRIRLREKYFPICNSITSNRIFSIKNVFVI